MNIIYQTLYNLELSTVGIILGSLLLAAHLAGLFNFERFKIWLSALPRNYGFGLGLLAVDFVWAFIIVSEMDLGEFYTLERLLQWVIIVGFFLVAYFVREFLAVRAIGFFLILLACPVLDAAFLKPPVTRLLLVALAFAWIFKGMFWVGMPFLLRDGITWVTASAGRWRAACSLGAVYGGLILLCATLFY